MNATTTAAPKDFVAGPAALLTVGACPNTGRFIDEITVSAGACNDPWVVHLECYPEEVLLRIRKGGRTVIMHTLAPAEARLASSSARALRLVALTHLKADGFTVEERSRRSGKC